MGLCQMPSSVVIVITMLLLLACCEASSLQQRHHQNNIRKMFDASPPSPSTGGGEGVHSARHRMSGCSDPEELVQVYQNIAANLPTGMPAYSLEITNTCINCTVCNVHLSCGDFANTELVDPATFRRLAINDCLVKDGGPIGPGEMVSFDYSNSFLYPMKVASASCDCH
ncbi:unnamed protein product [Alopecurus aequalis]